MLANGPKDAANLTHINVSLRSNLTNATWITGSIPVHNLSDVSYTHLHTSLVNTVTAPNSNNTFAVTFNASEVAGSTFYFDLISLFPETYKGRPNGLRKDLGRNIKDLNPQFLRFPGGNNIEGYSIAERWKWNETIGPLINRPGRVGTWGNAFVDGYIIKLGLTICQSTTTRMDLDCSSFWNGPKIWSWSQYLLYTPGTHSRSVVPKERRIPRIKWEKSFRVLWMSWYG